VGWLDLRVVGYVFMVAGLAGLILTLWVWSNRRRRVTTTTPVSVERERYIEEDLPERRY
jgi:hypothetical protein